MKISIGAYHTGAVLLAGSLLLSGCGYKTLPVPPETIVPKAVEDLRYTFNEKGVVLTWTYPSETIKGTDLTDISSFEVYRAVVAVDNYCPTCPIPFGEPVVLPGSMAGGEQRKASYESALLRSGEKYFFKVRSRTSWWAASADSNIVSFVWHMPAKAPEGVGVEAKDRSVQLRWLPPTLLMDGQPVDLPVQYQISRSADGKTYEEIGKPVQQTAYVDNNLRNGQQYFYRVQSLLEVEKNMVAGGMSEPVSAVPVDLAAPGVPAGVTVVSTGAGVKVFWEPVVAADLQGYHVYRRGAGQKKAERIGDVQAIYTIFEDKNVPASGGPYSYSVTSYDQMKPANESKPSAEASARE